MNWRDLMRWTAWNCAATLIQVGLNIVLGPSLGLQSAMVTGLVYALLQFPPLRRGLSHPGRWILFSLVGWVVSLPFAIAGAILGAIAEEGMYREGAHLPSGALIGAAAGATTGVVLATFQLGALPTNRVLSALWPVVNALGGAVLSLGVACCSDLEQVPQSLARMIASVFIYSFLTAPVILRLTDRQHSCEVAPLWWTLDTYADTTRA
jgi:hypothetical protein